MPIKLSSSLKTLWMALAGLQGICLKQRDHEGRALTHLRLWNNINGRLNFGFELSQPNSFSGSEGTSRWPKGPTLIAWLKGLPECPSLQRSYKSCFRADKESSPDTL